jgi:hypothetical protein
MRLPAAIGSLLLLLAPVMQAQESAPIRFSEIARQSGLVFTIDNAPTPEKHMIETMAGGLAVFDYNNDGRPDVFFTNGAENPKLEKTDPKFYNRLFRNEGNLKFTDVTAEAGVAGRGYSMGAAVADFDNDGFVDLFVAGVNRNLLYRNLGNGRFEDVTERAGIQSDLWAVAAAWLDYDRDGRLDLFITHYTKWPPATDRYCGDRARGIRVYCHPKYFDGLPNRLYRNRGDGAFEDVSRKAGLASDAGRGMSVAVGDADGDGWPDVFVTNDNMPNFLFRNRGDGTFEEVALLAGVALMDGGKPVASMGADFRDYDNDGLPDITVAALAGETFPLFRNRGKGDFTDATYKSRLASLTVRYGGWGPGLFDFNNDGWKDLFTSNAHVNDRVEEFEPHSYRQPNTVFLNQRDGTFRDVSAGAGPEFGAAVKAHRGCGFADFDGDGRIDVVVSALGQPAELWHNTSADENAWLIVKLEGGKSNRDGIGATVRAGNQWNVMSTAVGYSSSSHEGVHFGFGQAEHTDLEIKWPSGVSQTLKNVALRRVLRVAESSGEK